MFNVKDNKQGYIFDQAEIFRSEILPELPVESLRKYYHNKVDFDKQRLDSVHIQSNMRHLVGKNTEGIKPFRQS